MVFVGFVLWPVFVRGLRVGTMVLVRPCRNTGAGTSSEVFPYAAIGQKRNSRFVVIPEGLWREVLFMSNLVLSPDFMATDRCGYQRIPCHKGYTHQDLMTIQGRTHSQLLSEAQPRPPFVSRHCFVTR